MLTNVKILLRRQFYRCQRILCDVALILYDIRCATCRLD